MRTLRVAAALFVAALSIPALPVVTAAQPALLVKTNYPSVVVEPGQVVRFDLQVISATPRHVDLAIAAAPEGWQATLRGGGFVVGGVFGDPESPPSLELEVRVPPEATAGAHQVHVRGTSAGLSSTLVLTLHVGDTPPGNVTLEAEFPSFRGSADETFNFRLTLQNNTPEETTFGLQVADAPPGWQVEARPTLEARAATVTVEGGGSADIEVNVTPAPDAIAQEHPFRVIAAGPGDRRAEAELTVEITGTFNLQLTTSDERLSRDVRAGRVAEVGIVVRNQGSAPLRNVQLSATPPTGWEVTFEPSTVESVEPGGSEQVTARITPSGDAVAGDYSMTVTATGTDGGSDSFELRASVQPSRFWVVVGLLLILLTVLGLRWVFQKYGRR